MVPDNCCNDPTPNAIKKRDAISLPSDQTYMLYLTQQHSYDGGSQGPPPYTSDTHEIPQSIP